MDEDLEKLIKKLPLFLQSQLLGHLYNDQLIEIILDLGRRPEARFYSGPECLSQKMISWQDLDYITKRVSGFSTENRAGIERTLHRISCIRNRQFMINGLTCRVGRVIFGIVSVIRDLVESGQSVLILGKPGVGKTTIIREIARVLADENEKRVIVIDTSNEIAGESDIPHSGIGLARRMQVPKTEFQHQIMIEAVENHMPEVIIIDEIATELEVLAARTIAEKGVQLVGTTHGNCLENLIKNPPLSNLIGGIQHVTLGDEEARRRGSQKSVLERRSYPAFEIVIELNEQNYWTIHEDVKTSVDLILRRGSTFEQVRRFSSTERVEVKTKLPQPDCGSFLKNRTSRYHKNWQLSNQLRKKRSPNLDHQTLTVYSYSLSHNLFKEVFFKSKFKFILTSDVCNAGLIIGLKKHLKQNHKLKRLANEKEIPIYALAKVSVFEMRNLVRRLDRSSSTEC